MKIEVKGIELTHENLVNLLSCAEQSNPAFSYGYRAYDYQPYEDEGDDYEDKLAKVLLSGHRIFVFDHYAEDKTEFYGELKHVWKTADHCMRYEVDNKALIDGIEKAMNTSRGMQAFGNLIFDDGVQFDVEDADYLLQYCVFGDFIYG